MAGAGGASTAVGWAVSAGVETDNRSSRSERMAQDYSKAVHAKKKRRINALSRSGKGLENRGPAPILVLSAPVGALLPIWRRHGKRNPLQCIRRHARRPVPRLFRAARELRGRIRRRGSV